MAWRACAELVLVQVVLLFCVLIPIWWHGCLTPPLLVQARLCWLRRPAGHWKCPEITILINYLMNVLYSCRSLHISAVPLYFSAISFTSFGRSVSHYLQCSVMSCRMSVLFYFFKQHLCTFEDDTVPLMKAISLCWPCLFVYAKLFNLAAYGRHHRPCIGHYKRIKLNKYSAYK